MSFFKLILFTNPLNNLINIDLVKIDILMQQTPKISTSDIRYSIVLVIVCLLILVWLWLPDLLKKERN